ncbi:multicopper oxidase domain-containing protein [Burkholderia sp. Bp8963]|uniref:multicopper oxidase domain-containing protein n=1 Tax=Burkholderia sp. Bp8963 TaxID=2184547 RepID=UPI001639831F|nr:multicopper oxidase family protein [Burkholderia sp. Bp8963]
MGHITHRAWTATLAHLGRFARVGVATLAALLSLHAQAAAPGITGKVFNLTAAEARITQPDGTSVYSWGYGCTAGGTPPVFSPSTITGATCPTMQIPGPTLIVRQGDTITVTLTNNLPAAAGNTSILFPGFVVSATNGVPGLLAQEAANGGGTVTYTFVASTPGTHTYYSGTQGDLQVEMGMYGAIIVLPNTSVNTAGCMAFPDTGRPFSQHDFRNAPAAFDNSAACYDREYLFQFSEMDPKIHQQAEQQVLVNSSCKKPTGCMTVETEPYHPAYFMVNGRSMPDDMDPNYAPQYPHQPYNGNPHMHPGELVLLRIIGTGRWQHPFHEHGNHVRVLARDGNLLLSPVDPTNPTKPQLPAGPLLFTTTTTPGLTMDGIFYWTGKGLNWDVYGHGYPGDTSVCVPDANGYYTTASGAPRNAPNYYEWCQDHGKALEKAPFGKVASGGPVTLPDSNILTNGFWYGGSPYLGPDATVRATGPNGTTPPSGTVLNSPSQEAGFAFMWHSHNEREITTNNIFPGGMMMMMLVDPPVFPIDESN